jgi:hypothetical protein
MTPGCPPTQRLHGHEILSLPLCRPCGAISRLNGSRRSARTARCACSDHEIPRCHGTPRPLGRRCSRRIDRRFRHHRDRPSRFILPRGKSHGHLQLRYHHRCPDVCRPIPLCHPTRCPTGRTRGKKSAPIFEASQAFPISPKCPLTLNSPGSCHPDLDLSPISNRGLPVCPPPARECPSRCWRSPGPSPAARHRWN